MEHHDNNLRGLQRPFEVVDTPVESVLVSAFGGFHLAGFVGVVPTSSSSSSMVESSIAIHTNNRITHCFLLSVCILIILNKNHIQQFKLFCLTMKVTVLITNITVKMFPLEMEWLMIIRGLVN